MSSNQQNPGAAAAPIPVTAARAEKDAIAAATRAQSQRPRNTDADVEMAVRIAAALHAPPSIPEQSWDFTWAVGVTTEGQIIAANSYGVAFIPDKVNLPSQVTLVSADEQIPAGHRGQWVRYPFVALQGWAAFHEKSLRVIIGTKEEVQLYSGSVATRTLADDDIPPNGIMKGRNRFEVIAPQTARRLADWAETELNEMLPPQPVLLQAPDPKAGDALWLKVVTPLMQTTGENYRPQHLAALEAYARHRESVGLYHAYTAPFVAAQRDAITEWLYWGHLAAILTDAQNPALGG